MVGLMYFNLVYMVFDMIVDFERREFVLCLLIVGNVFGKLIVGFFGLF